MILYEILLKV